MSQILCGWGLSSLRLRKEMQQQRCTFILSTCKFNRGTFLKNASFVIEKSCRSARKIPSGTERTCWVKSQSSVWSRLASLYLFINWTVGGDSSPQTIWPGLSNTLAHFHSNSLECHFAGKPKLFFSHFLFAFEPSHAPIRLAKKAFVAKKQWHYDWQMLLLE